MSSHSGYSSLPGSPGNVLGNAIAGGNFLGGKGLAIPGARTQGQPVLPGEQQKLIDQLYGPPAGAPQNIPVQPQLPQAFLPYAQNDNFTRFMNARKAIAARNAGFDNKTVS